MLIKEREVSGEQIFDHDIVLDRVYRGRRIQSAQDLDYALGTLIPYHRMSGLDAACEMLFSALQEQEKIIIIGDYDVDGATATSVLVSGLRNFGFKNVDYIIPNRMVDGYGLTPVLVDRAAERQANMIITVDNGIVSYQGVDRANEIGLKVIITDHHLAADKLPEAVIVNPNQPGCDFPSKAIAGVGVAFYVLIALRAFLREKGAFAGQEPSLMPYLDLVALGTIADCVQLDKNNRTMITHGLNIMRQGKARSGIVALLKISKRNPRLLEADDMGFSVGPRLNAAGRLEDMSLGVQCLLTEDKQEAMQYAQRLDEINLKRREMQSGMLQEAFKIIEALPEQKQLAIVYNKDWHEGIIGLVASMLKERYHVPTIAMSLDESGDFMKGSCRSIPGVNIRDVLVDYDRLNPGVLLKFGGHAMAAGLSVKYSEFSRFKKGMLALCQKHLTKDILQKEVLVDGSLPQSHRTITFAKSLLDAGPWGNGFEKPVFYDHFTVVDQYLVGEKHLKLRISDGSQEYEGIWFNSPEGWPNKALTKVRVVYTIGVNEFNAKRRLQFLVIWMHVDDGC